MQVKTENTHHEDILGEIQEGLKKSPKRMPTKLFYDEQGSKLFDRICELDEYYPTRTELKRSHHILAMIVCLLNLAVEAVLR